MPSSDGWYDWRDLANSAIEKALRWPLEGMCFDIENNAFWEDA